MNFQESVEHDMNFYVFARDLNKYLLDINYNMISTDHERIYKLPYYKDGSSYNFFLIDYVSHTIDYRNIPDNGTYSLWHTLDFQRELITQSDLDALKNMATNIQEQIKKIKVEYKIKELEKDFE